MPTSLKRRLLTGGAWVVLGKLLTASSTLIVTSILARMLSADAFGAFGLGFTLATVAAMTAQLGNHQAVVRLVAESIGAGDPARARSVVGLVFRYVALGTLLIAALLAAGPGSWLAREVVNSPMLAGAMGAVAAWAAVMSLQIFTSETFRGFKDLRRATIYGGVISGVLAVGLLLLFWWQVGAASLEQVIWIIVATLIVSVLLGGSRLRRLVRGLERGAAFPSRELFAISLPIWITGLTTFVLQHSDVWIVGAFLTQSEVGIYFAAVRLVVVVSQPLVLVNLVVPPFIAELYAAGEKQRLQRVLRNTATVAGLPAFILLFTFVLFGAPIMGLVFGQEFRAGAVVLALLSVGKLVNVWTGSCGMTLIMTGHQTPLMRITIVTSVLTVIGAILAVGRFGMVGVAAVVSGGTVAQNLAMWLAARSYCGLWTHAGLPRLADAKALLRRE
jgi:O-antigen/teichoic acid export membrane protein